MSDDIKKKIDVVFIAGGKFHDIDFARLEILKLLAEDDRMKTRVFEDYSNLHAIEKADFLITYTYNWYDDSGSLEQTYTSSTDTLDIFLGSGTTGGVWTCEVIASDGSLTATASTTITVDSDWAGPLEFTHCNQSGRDGPSQSQCDAEYSGDLLENLVTVSSGVQSWTVPSTGTYSIEIAGAEGGSGYGGAGGRLCRLENRGGDLRPELLVGVVVEGLVEPLREADPLLLEGAHLELAAG